MTLFEHYLAMMRAFFEHLGGDAASTLHHYLTLAQPVLEQYGYLAVFGAVMVEGCGIPAPGQTMLMAGAILAAHGGMSIEWVLALAFLAAVLGNSMGYLLGRWGGRPLLEKVGINEVRMLRMENLFNRYGGGVVFAGRFLDGLRQLSGIVAGTLEMPWWKFTVFNVLGAVAWTALWGLGMYFFDEHLKTVFAVFHRLEPYIIIISLFAVIGLIVYLRHNHKPTDVS
ncbi:MAG: DedA family protein [Candidatus Competibacteraceae bacterium]|jgi:membrane protein DedA with SNARE-associated domain|nr:DedA family protein [Candidatus Competibacteraceae bacterium]